MNPNAQALGRMNKGKPKRFSDMPQRRAILDAGRAKGHQMKRDAKATRDALSRNGHQEIEIDDSPGITLS